MQYVQFPIEFTFKISTFANDFVAKDASGQVLAYVRQKMFKFVEEVNVYNNESKSELQYQIKANKWLDFSASYQFTDGSGQSVGRVARKGWASIWKARYEIYDAYNEFNFHVQEENAWVKVGDALLGEIPILGIFAGYLFNPSYIVTRPDGELVARLRKHPSFFGRRFTVSAEGDFSDDEAERIMLGLMMMILLERRRG